MHEEDEPIDVTALPELRRLAEAVRRSGKPRLLRRDGETLAMLVPLAKKAVRPLVLRKLTAKDIAAFRAAAGTWSDVTVEHFVTDVYTARDVADGRPPVDARAHPSDPGVVPLAMAPSNRG
jgi:hypothetical protein